MVEFILHDLVPSPSISVSDLSPIFYCPCHQAFSLHKIIKMIRIITRTLENLSELELSVIEGGH